jgi:tRNA nucleotidyltransferase (CCA-adding enzyme)
MRLVPPGHNSFIDELSIEALRQGLRLYAVGGCVRDWLAGRPCGDIDFLVSGPAEGLAAAVCARHGGTWQVFGSFQTVRCFTATGERMDFARFRRETYSRPAALPHTEPATTIEEDLLRRDFTVNAMAVELTGNSYELTDLYGGREDLMAGLIRVLHRRSFTDDPTRIYRAARFAGRFGWRLSDDTAELAAQAIKDGIPGLLSRERLRNELVKILSEKDPAPALEIIAENGSAAFIHPGLRSLPGISSFDGINARIAALAADMGLEYGMEFIAGLRLSKKQNREILELAGFPVKMHRRGSVSLTGYKGPVSAVSPTGISATDFSEAGTGVPYDKDKKDEK